MPSIYENTLIYTFNKIDHNFSELNLCECSHLTPDHGLQISPVFILLEYTLSLSSPTENQQ